MLKDKTKTFKSYNSEFELVTAGLGPETKYWFWCHYLRASNTRPELTYSDFRQEYLGGKFKKSA